MRLDRGMSTRRFSTDNNAVFKTVNVPNNRTLTLSPLSFNNTATVISRTTESPPPIIASLDNAATATSRTIESPQPMIASLDNAATAISRTTESPGNMVATLDNTATVTSRASSESAGTMLASTKTAVESESHQKTQSGFRSHFFDTKTTKTT